MVFKCKMCGGELNVSEESTIAECKYCGSKQTLPRLSDDKRRNLYDRANHFRRNNDYDKALDIYEKILNEDNTDAEAYWSIVLCKYGIEYVQDSTSGRRIPTVNRAQYTSIFADDDYKSAINYADREQKALYEKEAKEIDSIQKGILAVSEKEPPFDVFICYKETDGLGGRTKDSVLAQEMYYDLTNEGFNVFFSRITLEDKLGTAYEPYIFNALNSAKVMIVVGSCKENFNAVWVKNEWSRFLSLIKKGEKKTLIPAYKDMDPYDLPEEFSHLQAQDTSKIGFMQDLIRGIKKLTYFQKKDDISDNKVTTVQDVAPLIKRAYMFLNDAYFRRADEYAEKLLDFNPECAEAYFIKFLAVKKLRGPEFINQLGFRIDSDPNVVKALTYADLDFRAELNRYIQVNLEHLEDLKRIKAEKERQALIEKKAKRKKIKKILLRALLIFSACALCAVLITTIAITKNKKDKADDLKARHGLVLQKIDDSYMVSGAGKNINNTEIIIPSSYKGKKVVAIAQNAFSDCTSLVSITIPDGITDIGNNAFSDCSLLENIYITDVNAWVQINGLKNLMVYGKNNKNLYCNDNLLTEVNIDTATDIKLRAFYNNVNITKVTLGAQVKNIENFAFAGCTSIEDIYFTGNIDEWVQINGLNNLIVYGKSSKNLYINNELLTEATISAPVINDYAFFGYDKLTTVILGDQVTSIGNNAFYYCVSLVNFTIGKGITAIGENWFDNCKLLENIYYSGDINGWVQIDNLINILKYGVSSKNIYINNELLTEANITDTAVIKENVFYNYDKLTSVTIGAKVKLIRKKAFYGCSSLKNASFENNLGWYADYSSSSSSGIKLTLTDLSKNAEYLNQTYLHYYLIRSN